MRLYGTLRRFRKIEVFRPPGEKPESFFALDEDEFQVVTLLFSSLILLRMVGGTIWVLANLAMRLH